MAFGALKGVGGAGKSGSTSGAEAQGAGGVSTSSKIGGIVGQAASASQYSPISNLVSHIAARRARDEGARQFELGLSLQKRQQDFAEKMGLMQMANQQRGIDWQRKFAKAMRGA